MPRDHQYFVYILASRSRNLYIGVTNNLTRRLAQHRAGNHDSFTTRYRTYRLVYLERFQYINNAIAREKYLKHCTRAEKLALITASNPTWTDLLQATSATPLLPETVALPPSPHAPIIP